MIRTGTGIAAMAMAGVIVCSNGAEAQQRVVCGDLYTVQAGDSLSAIAQRAYSSFNYQPIFDNNQDVMTSPSILVVGQPLFIPCLDGTGPATKAEALGQTVAAEPAPEATVAEQPAAVLPTITPTIRQVASNQAGVDLTFAAAPTPIATPAADVPIRFLTGSDYAPFTHRDMPEGGMITELINRAMMRADALRPYRITWENDWSRHLTEMLPGEDYDLGFPWFRPDCNATGKLSEAMRARCSDYDFSQPVYEVVISYYVRRGDPVRRARNHEALYGKRLCRPAGYFTFDLEQADLVEPNVTMVRPESPGDCFAMLANDQVDVVAINVLLGETEIAEQDLGGTVAEAPNLASIQTLHVVSAKSNPNGRGFLALVDKGLRQLREEGVWFEVTRRHLTEHARQL